MKESFKESIAKWGIWEKADSSGSPTAAPNYPYSQPDPQIPGADDEDQEMAAYNMLLNLIRQLTALQGAGDPDEEQQENDIYQQMEKIVVALCQGC